MKSLSQALFLSVVLMTGVVRADETNIISVNELKPINSRKDILCQGIPYVWAGVTRPDASNLLIEHFQKSNSTPLKFVIKQISKKAASIDGDKFEVLYSDANEGFFLFHDKLNVMTVAIEYKTASALYTKTFSSASVKRATSSWFAVCRNI